MKKRILSFVLTLCMLVSMLTIVPMTANATDPEVWDGEPASAYASGSGTEADPYIINNGAQLAYFSQQVNSKAITTEGKYFKLGADIVLNTGNAEDWVTTAPTNLLKPIGIADDGTDDGTWRAGSFNGTFDGNGKTISGFYVNSVDETFKAAGTGLFAIIGPKAVVKNFALVNSYVKSNRAVGAIGLGLNSKTDGFLIDSIYSDIIVEGYNHVGGILGQMSETNGDGPNSKISNCIFNGKATIYNIEKNPVGGAAVENVGGIFGNSNSRVITIENCLNSGTVIGTKYVAGILGRAEKENATIIRCINIGTVSVYASGTPKAEIANIFGATDKILTVTNCYYTGNNSGTVANKTPETFISETNVVKVTLAEIMGTDATVTIEGWTKRANDVMIPTTIYTLFNPEIVVPLNVPSVGDTYTSGNGNTASPYIINTATQLVNFSSRVNNGYDLTAHVKLGANITLNTGDASTWGTTAPDNVFDPIGVNTTGFGGIRDYAFCGTFDGDGHTISGLYVNVSAAAFIDQGAGLFGIIGTTAEIKNFAVVNSYVTSNKAVGVIGLALADGFLVDSIYSDIIAEGSANVGGVVGQLSGTSGDSATISNCLFTGSVKSTTTANAESGGILGSGNTRFVQINNCLNAGSVTAGGNYIAGIIGRNDETTTITNCISIGNIIQTGTSQYTAGIWTGALRTDKTITMTNCYSTGNTLYIRQGTNGTITPTNVGYFTEKFLGAGAQTFTGWTARTGDIMVPTTVAGYVTTDILYDFSTSSGAAVRFNTPTGLRFTGFVGKAYLDSLNTTYGSANVSYGMIIAPTAYVTAANDEFTIEALTTAGKTYKVIEAKSVENILSAEADGYYKFNAVLSNVQTANYANEFSAITYIKIVDGATTTYIYADSSTSRSIEYVAEMALADLSDSKVGKYQNSVVVGEDTKYSPYTTAQRGILAGFTTGA